MKREFHHQWQIDRVYEEQRELMSLERRKMVSEMDPGERKWLNCLIWARTLCTQEEVKKANEAYVQYCMRYM
jgi:hypothetical protein